LKLIDVQLLSQSSAEGSSTMHLHLVLLVAILIINDTLSGNIQDERLGTWNQILSMYLIFAGKW
jgi:hypothetical protein